MAVLLIVGYGVRSYALQARDRRIAEAQTAAQADAERRQRNETLMDQYGSRSSLEDLESAIKYYEKKS